ncbi:MAG TPA: serine/threonine-protein kinase [Gemmataceae bacterium]|jgi:WD40 repeat protein|nr:serine/threonine-protein kinase [Gemmataceae bacterium]
MTATCLAPETLRKVIDSTLSSTAHAEAVAHLDSCSHCQIRLEQMGAGGSGFLDTALAARQDTPPATGSAFWPALERIEREIRSSPDPEATAVALSAVGNRIPEYEFLAPSDDPKALGKIERFRIDELVGRGGMGMVFKAFDEELQRPVAVKVLDPQYAKDKLAQGRFCREARSAAGLMHENVVTIHHVETCSTSDLSYIVMQFVPGKSLQDRLDEGKPLPIREAVRIAAATASALAAAHAQGLIHRDIKPGNILIEEPSGRVLLTDFGLARLTQDVKLTQTGFVAGTPLYMSPEQARGEEIDARSDLFSLGSVVYAMLAGVPPFQGSSAFVVLRQVTDKRARPVQDVNPAVPDMLAEVVDRLMEKNPAHRFPSASETADALNAVLARLPADLPAAPARSRRCIFRACSRRYSPPALVGIAAVLALFGVSELTKLTHLTVLGQRGREVAAQALISVEGSLPAVADPPTPVAYELPRGDGPVWAVAFDPCDDVLATATEGGSVKLWDAHDGTVRGELDTSKHKSPVWGLAFNPEGTLLVTASDDGAVHIWDVLTRRENELTLEHGAPVRSVAFSPDGKTLVTGTRTGTITVWDLVTGKQKLSWIGHDGAVVAALAFHKDGNWIASSSTDKTVKLWDVHMGTARATLPGHAGPVYAVAFDPSGTFLASAGWDRTIRLWNVNTTQQVRTFDVHADDVFALTFSPLGRHLISAGQDRTAKLIDIETGDVKAVFRGHGGPIHNVSISKDGRQLAAGGRDGTVRVWPVEP